MKNKRDYLGVCWHTHTRICVHVNMSSPRKMLEKNGERLRHTENLTED